MIDINQVCKCFQMAKLPYTYVDKKNTDGGEIRTTYNIGDQAMAARISCSSITTLVTLYINPTGWNNSYANAMVEKFNQQVKPLTGFTASIRMTQDYDDPVFVLDATVKGYRSEAELTSKVADKIYDLSQVGNGNTNFLYLMLINVRKNT